MPLVKPSLSGVGLTSSANYGHHLGRAIAMGYVRHEAGVDGEFLAGGKWEIEVGLKRYAARASLKPMYDPTSARMKV